MSKKCQHDVLTVNEEWRHLTPVITARRITITCTDCGRTLVEAGDLMEQIAPMVKVNLSSGLANATN